MYIYIWSYEIKNENKNKFESLYNQTGEWVKLFQNDENYIKTEFLKDIQNPNKYITIDYWKSKKSHELFRIKYDNEFNALDKRCGFFTEIEIFLGEYES